MRNLLSDLKLLKQLLLLKKNPSSTEIKKFIEDFYSVIMPPAFYELLTKRFTSKKTKELFNVISTNNIYKLIAHLKHDNEPVEDIEEYLPPQDYFNIPKRHINHLVEMIKNMPIKNNKLSEQKKDKDLWLLRRRAIYKQNEFEEIAYKLYLTFGLETSRELINQKYGPINYEQLHYLMKNIELSKDSSKVEVINNYLFGNKKDTNIPIRNMLEGKFIELFLNFEYFHNNLDYFTNKLGTKLSTDKLRALLQERFLTTDPTTPEITGELREDMLSSYYHKYDSLDEIPSKVMDRNIDAFKQKLRNKYKSSIPQIDLNQEGEITIELLNLSDPRNLTHGYRSGNCFRINGDASILFSKFLDSEHMRILSFSTSEYKDYAMVLLMRNGNTLIAQGIETSKWVPSEIKGKKLYEATKKSLKQIMDYMNQEDDEIVATIIGSTNENVSNYNQQYLPFLVGPIVENLNNYYNGISNYQCLLDLKPGKTIYDIKPFCPTKRYFDKREAILSRKDNYPNQEIERRLISLRFQRSQTEEGFSFYQEIFNHHEQETTCNKDWYVTLFTDGTIDSFISNTDDERAKKEYENQLKIYQKKKKK